MTDFLSTLRIRHPDGTITAPSGEVMVPPSSTTEVPIPQNQGHDVASQQSYRHRSTVHVYGRKWYFRIKRSEEPDGSPDGSPDSGRVKKKARGLLDDVSISDIDGKLVVCLITQTGVRLYTLFENYLEFADLQQRVEERKRCFYEVAFGEFPQKPHFDVDLDMADLPPGASLDVTGESLKDTIIYCLHHIFREKAIALNLERDVLIYTSHSPTKRSYHIIVNNYCHFNNKEAKALYDRVVAMFPDELRRYVNNHKVDPAVYSPKQQFRILGSQKLNSGRIKRFHKTWTYQGSPITHVYIEEPDTIEYEGVLQLEESLLSATSNCSLLPSFIQENNVLTTSPGSGSGSGGTVQRENITKDLATKAFHLLLQKEEGAARTYKIISINGGIVCLKRLRPSRCSNCSRIHEHENPYLIVAGEDSPHSVYFHCRRAPIHQKSYLGKINDDAPPKASEPGQDPVTEVNEMPDGTFVALGPQSVLETLREIAISVPEKTSTSKPRSKEPLDVNDSRRILHGK